MTREPTPIDAIANDHTRRLAALSPIEATFAGIQGYDQLLPDLSPDGIAARTQLARDTLAAIASAEQVDDVDAVTVASMTDRLGLQLELDAAGALLPDLNVISSPLQSLRDVFDLMPTQTETDWSNIASRLRGVPDAITGYIAALREGASRGLVPARLQVDEGIKQAEELADGRTSFFVTFAAGATDIPDTLRRDLSTGAAAAAAAYTELGGFLSGELAAQAPTSDAVGRERYELWSREFVGAAVDLDETYEWGLSELDRMSREQEVIAAQIAGPGASVVEAIEKLDNDPDQQLIGTQALREWMQQKADEAISALDGVHFDIPEPVRRIECMIAPTENGGIYYTGPSEDFTRPGRMWWSVPPGVTRFAPWRELTTVYHEGVPGHHLQIAQALTNGGELNSWRRLLSWNSGHGEGWALYAERLMDEFGFLSTPGERLGMLDGQRMRAARVVVDLGVHLGLPAPERWGGGTWDAAKAWELLKANVNMDHQFLRFELNRYLGWPGQAPSYKIGQRLWEQARADAQARLGAAFDLKTWHTRALNLGSVPLSLLPSALG